MNSELWDKQALYELMCRYCNAVDRKQFDRLRPLYHPGAINDFGPIFQGDSESFIVYLRRQMRQMTTQHMIGNHHYCIKGDSAEGEIYTMNFHIIHGPDGVEQYVAGGRYIDHYIRAGNQWLISDRLRLIDWSRRSPVQNSGLQAQLSEDDDPVFALLPNLYPEQ